MSMTPSPDISVPSSPSAWPPNLKAEDAKLCELLEATPGVTPQSLWGLVTRHQSAQESADGQAANGLLSSTPSVGIPNSELLVDYLVREGIFSRTGGRTAAAAVKGYMVCQDAGQFFAPGGLERLAEMACYGQSPKPEPVATPVPNAHAVPAKSASATNASAGPVGRSLVAVGGGASPKTLPTSGPAQISGTQTGRAQIFANPAAPNLAASNPAMVFSEPPPSSSASGLVMAAPGDLIGQYRLVACIGRGPKGIVYTAEDTQLGRLVALKQLSPHLTDDPLAVQRFLIEARVAGRLDHPNCLNVYAVGTVERAVYMVMMLMPGAKFQEADGQVRLIRSAADLVARGQPLDPLEATQIVRQAAEALIAVHSLGIVHGNIKPTNVLLAETGLARLADFGIGNLARHAESQLSAALRASLDSVQSNPRESLRWIGTAAYMNPEQAAALVQEPCSDIYSLGAVYYALLAGRPPYGEMSPSATIFQHVTATPPDLRRLVPNIPESCVAVAETALAKSPRDRFPSAVEMVERLSEIETALARRRELCQISGTAPQAGLVMPRPTSRSGLAVPGASGMMAGVRGSAPGSAAGWAVDSPPASQTTVMASAGPATGSVVGYSAAPTPARPPSGMFPSTGLGSAPGMPSGATLGLAHSPSGPISTPRPTSVLGGYPARPGSGMFGSPVGRLTSPRQLQVGTLLGRCLLTERIGEGGAGVVFRALHQGLNIPVAVKVLRAETFRDPTAFEQLRGEARLMARLEHPHIVRVWDFDDTGDLPFLVMEYINGLTLRELIGQSGALRPNRAVKLISQVAEALACAATSHVIHRDIKPANILLTKEGHAKLADLGLAVTVDAVLRRGWGSSSGSQGASSSASGRFAAGGAANQAGANLQADLMVGTAAYMSPEQASGSAELDLRSDIYSLGVTLFHAVTGQLPFRGRTIMDLMVKHAREAPPRPHEICPDMDRRLSALILDMMAKRPQDRPANYQDLLASLNALAKADERRPPPTSPHLRAGSLGSNSGFHASGESPTGTDWITELPERTNPLAHNALANTPAAESPTAQQSSPGASVAGAANSEALPPPGATHPTASGLSGWLRRLSGR